MRGEKRNKNLGDPGNSRGRRVDCAEKKKEQAKIVGESDQPIVR